MFSSLFPSFKRLQEEIKNLREENKELKEQIDFYKPWFYGSHSHSEDIQRAEQFFIKVFRQLHLHISAEEFTTKSVKHFDEHNIPDVTPETTPYEDFKVWCLKAAYKKYGDNKDEAIEYAQKLYDFVSKR